MTIWDQVTNVTDIRLYYHSGEPSATIYGNGRHCVAFNISFNAKKGTEELDISGQDLSQHVQLINFDSSKPLLQGSESPDSNSLFYSRECSDYNAQLIPRLVSLPSAIQPDKTKLRGLVTFYVYANAESDFTSNIAVRFLLRSGNTRDTSAGNSPALKLGMKILKPPFYSTDQFSPLEWLFIRENATAQLYNAFIRPKDESRFWKRNEFNRPDKTAATTLMYIGGGKDNLHFYHVASLGPEVNSAMVLLGLNLPLAYNSEAGALTVIKQNILVDVDNQELMNAIYDVKKREPLKVKLYDQFGNVAALSFSWEDPANPKIRAVSPDF